MTGSLPKMQAWPVVGHRSSRVVEMSVAFRPQFLQHIVRKFALVDDAAADAELTNSSCLYADAGLLRMLNWSILSGGINKAHGAVVCPQLVHLFAFSSFE